MDVVTMGVEEPAGPVPVDTGAEKNLGMVRADKAEDRNVTRADADEADETRTVQVLDIAAVKRDAATNAVLPDAATDVPASVGVADGNTKDAEPVAEDVKIDEVADGSIMFLAETSRRSSCGHK